MSEFMLCGALIGGLIAIIYWNDEFVAKVIGGVVGGVLSMAILAFSCVVVISTFNGEFTVGLAKAMPTVLFTGGLAGTVLFGYILKKVRQHFFLLVINMVCLIVVILTAFIPVNSRAQSFVEVQATMDNEGSAALNLVARPAVNISDRWNLQALAYVGQEWAEMYTGPQYMIVQPTDSLGIIQMCLSVGVGLETTEAYCFGCIFEAVGSNWDAIAAVEYGGSGLFYKGQFSYGITGPPISFVGLGLYCESLVGVGPRLTWTKIMPNNNAVQFWTNVIYNPKLTRPVESIGLTCFW